MSLLVNVKLHSTANQEHEYYIYDVLNDLFLQGKPGKHVDFIGYLSMRLLPTVYALYHTMEDTYALDFSAPPLSLPFLVAVTTEEGMHGLYNHVDETNPGSCTVIHIARYPTGYCKVTDSDLATLSYIFATSSQGTSIILQSWICSKSTHIIPADSSSTIGLHQQAATPVHCTRHHVDRSICKIMRFFLKKTTKKPIPENEILNLASPWLSQCFYDARHALGYTLDDSHAGLGLANGMFGGALMDKISDGLQMFLRPSAYTLPLADNGFFQFMRHQACSTSPMGDNSVRRIICLATKTCQLLDHSRLTSNVSNTQPNVHGIYGDGSYALATGQ
ncbi:hypothetical protein DFJ58DRAFT_844304 [Suillus subalutaceus]|uniref:uncharacterized protein n=1 Tax=Suillus subalutaceus TaxID=48586 RepID=UPI001B86DADF|nr:uncharacterized protein DFJ58DRAFT_844304 [Suillus subalutaceus]KAG1843451.1 hypothetical protein DFJ58DRAFT_844304 [Suillus subalutaceus]